MNQDLIEHLIITHEGSRATVYNDTKGNPTVGVGCNLNSASAPDDIHQVGANYDKIRSGEASLTPVQIQALLQLQLSRVIYQAQVLVPEFDSLPEIAQAVVCDLIFNLGMRGFGLFKFALAAIRARRWSEAADQLKASKWYSEVNPKGYPESEVGNRGTDDVRMLRSLA